MIKPLSALANIGRNHIEVQIVICFLILISISVTGCAARRVAVKNCSQEFAESIRICEEL